MAMFLQTHQDYGSTYMERIFSLAIWSLGWESFVLGGKHNSLTDTGFLTGKLRIETEVLKEEIETRSVSLSGGF